jgi:hypothetical protein
MDTDEEPPGLSFSSKTETGCIENITICIVVGLLPFVYFFSMADTENDDIRSLYVEYDAIIADSKTITAKIRIGQRFSILEWITNETQERVSDTFFNFGIEPDNVLDSFLGVHQAVVQCPNTSS